MALLDELRKKLDPETFTKVTDALGDDFNYDLISRSRLNKAIAQRNEARAELAKLQQSGSEPGEDDEEDSGAESEDGSAEQKKPGASKQSNKGGNKGITKADLDAAVQAERQAGEAKVKELQLKFAATAKLQEAKFIDPDMVLAANLIDFSKVEMDDKGAITKGLDDQIKTLATAKPYLIAKSGTGAGAGAGAATGTGKDGGAVDFGSITSRDEFLKLDTAKQMEFKATNPDVFKGFMQNL